MQNEEFDNLVSAAKMNDKRWEILRYLKQYSHKHHWNPDIREIGYAVKISSTSIVNYHLYPLRSSGLVDGLVLESGHTAPRTLHLTDLGREFLEFFEKERNNPQ